MRVSYLPVARPTDGTNFRAFKIYGEGDVFHQNMGMKSDVPLPNLTVRGRNYARDYASSVAPFARVQAQEVQREPRENRPLTNGDVLEFEFGVFIDPAHVCASCHPRNGGGAVLAGALDADSSLVFKLYDAGALGDQAQLQGARRAALAWKSAR